VALQVAVSLQIIIRTTIAGAIFKMRLFLHRKKLVAQKAKNREILKGRKRRERKEIPEILPDLEIFEENKWGALEPI
jgi:hypothetical protein